MKIINNITNTLAEDLRTALTKSSSVAVAAACFSVYAYEELKKQLEQIEQLRFIFTSPAFLKEQAPKELLEFYIPLPHLNLRYIHHYIFYHFLN